MFVAACYGVFLCGDGPDAAWRREQARLRQAFRKYDADASGLLEKREFLAMVGGDEVAPGASADAALAQLAALGIDFDRRLSFGEFALWRSLVASPLEEAFADST